MAVREVLKEGSVLPVGGEEPPAPPKERRPTIFDKALRMKREATELEMEAAAVKAGLLAGQPSTQASEPPIKMSLDLGAVLNSSQKMVADAITLAQGESKERLVTLEKQLVDLHHILTTPQPHKSDLEVYQTVKATIDPIVADIAKKLDVTSSHPQTSDLPRLIELEGLRMERESKMQQWQLDREERQREHETDMAEKKRRWEVEDRHWEEEFKFKREEFTVSKEIRSKGLENLEDILTSVTGALEKSDEGGSSTLAEGGIISSGPHHIKSFPCGKCGVRVEVPFEAKIGEQIACSTEGCGAVYELTETRK